MLPTDRGRARTALKNLGVTEPLHVRYLPVSLVLLVIVVAIWALWAVENGRPWGNDINGKDAFTGVLSLGVFVIGYHQWRSARQETSLERYYDRLKLANDARNALSEEDHKIPPLRMYVYIELDNLEYVLQKFRLGYMAPEHALRGVNAFNSRLGRVHGFKEALESLPEDLSGHAGYQRQTGILVQSLCRSHAAKSVA